MRFRPASRVLGVVATAVSAAGVVLAIVVLFDHGAHPPHEDVDLFLGLIGLIVALAALGGSIALLLSAGAKRP